MERKFTIEYWEDDGWYVGRLKEIPHVFSQGETLEELKRNIIEVYNMLIEEEKRAVENKKCKYLEIGVDI